MEKIVGVIYEHGYKDWSLWLCGMSEEDEQTVKEILKKYTNDGFSVRGKEVYDGIDQML